MYNIDKMDAGTDVVLIENKKKSIRNDRLICIAITSSFAVLMIEFFILFFFNISENSAGSIVKLMAKVIVGLLFLISFPIVIKRNWQMFVGTYLIGTILFLYNYLVFPQNSEAITSVVFPFFFICLPCFIYSNSIYDKKILMDVISKVSNGVFFIGTLIGILVLTNQMSIGSYSMPFSYYMLLPAIVDSYKFSVKKSACSIIKVLISISLIIAYGSRGTIMCFAVYIMLIFIRSIKKFTNRTLVKFAGLFLAGVCVIVNFKSILMFIYELLIRFGITSRTLYSFMQSNLDLSGRGAIYNTVLYEIGKNPILGIGITGDRVITGFYSHDIFIELLSGFGVIIGTIIIVILLIICYKAITVKNGINSDIIIIWFSLGFRLLISGSYLEEITFWIFLGLAISEINSRQTMKVKNDRR